MDNKRRKKIENLILVVFLVSVCIVCNTLFRVVFPPEPVSTPTFTSTRLPNTSTFTPLPSSTVAPTATELVAPTATATVDAETPTKSPTFTAQPTPTMTPLPVVVTPWKDSSARCELRSNTPRCWRHR